MNLPNRHSIRLKDYDYSSNGAYFVTICTHNREILFGSIVTPREQPGMILNQYGIIVEEIIKSLNRRFPIDIPIYQIMSNHLHLIIVIDRMKHNVGAVHEPPLQLKRSLLSQIVGFLKMNTTKAIHQSVGAHHDAPIWQRNYYEHIIRNEKDFAQISQYILDNPLTWNQDENNVVSLAKG